MNGYPAEDVGGEHWGHRRGRPRLLLQGDLLCAQEDREAEGNGVRVARACQDQEGEGRCPQTELHMMGLYNICLFCACVVVQGVVLCKITGRI